MLDIKLLSGTIFNQDVLFQKSKPFQYHKETLDYLVNPFRIKYLRSLVVTDTQRMVTI